MGWFRRLIGRKPPPRVIDRRRLNEDWAVGDLAECVRDDWYNLKPFDPKVGDVLRVCEFVEGVAHLTGLPSYQCYALAFDGKPQNYAWVCTAFRKLQQIHEPAEAEFTALIKRPIRKPVEA